MLWASRVTGASCGLCDSAKPGAGPAEKHLVEKRRSHGLVWASQLPSRGAGIPAWGLHAVLHLTPRTVSGAEAGNLEI